MRSSQPNESSKPRRSPRFSIEVLLAGVVALAIIVVVLAGAFSLGERELAQFSVATRLPAPDAHTLHASPGLHAPAALPQSRVPRTAIQSPAPHVAVPATPDADDEPAPPPVPAAPDRLADVIRLSPSIGNPTTLSSPASHPKPSLGEFLGFVQFTKIRDALLNRPEPVVNRTVLQPPKATRELAQARAQSHLSPYAVHELLAERQALPPLWERRSQARIDPARLPATQPSDR